MTSQHKEKLAQEGSPSPITQAKDVEQAKKWVLCPHPERNRVGGNDYLACGDCGFEWDYRREYDPRPHAIETLISAVLAQQGQEIAREPRLHDPNCPICKAGFKPDPPVQPKTDHGAGLIHQAIPECAETEPRPNITRTAGERTVTIKDGIYHSEPPSVAITGSALAGVIDGLGGDSGATRIDITDHEIVDMVLSGQAYSLDGRYNFKNKSALLDRAWAAHEKAGSGSRRDSGE